jgi:hypothetical protein
MQRQHTRCESDVPAVSPVAGEGFIYDVYTDQPGPNSRTEFVRSERAGGLTFTEPVAVNDVSTGQRLMPAVAADTNGLVHIRWFDTRNSGDSTRLLDIFATFTRNNGTSFAPNARVTSTQIDADESGFIAWPRIVLCGLLASFSGEKNNGLGGRSERRKNERIPAETRQ